MGRLSMIRISYVIGPHEPGSIMKPCMPRVMPRVYTSFYRYTTCVVWRHTEKTPRHAVRLEECRRVAWRVQCHRLLVLLSACCDVRAYLLTVPSPIGWLWTPGPKHRHRGGSAGGRIARVAVPAAAAGRVFNKFAQRKQRQWRCRRRWRWCRRLQ